MNIILETPRLILREFEMSDAESVLELHSDPEVQKYVGQDVVTSIVEVKRDIKKIWEKEYKKYGFARWAVILKEGDQFSGWAGLKYLPEYKEVDLGYRFLQRFWGMGIATEISIEIVKYGFETLKLKRIIGAAMLDNKASIRVLEKAGLKFDRLEPYGDEEEDSVWYALDREDYATTSAVAK